MTSGQLDTQEVPVRRPRPLRVGLVGACDLVAQGLAAMVATCPGRVDLVHDRLVTPGTVDVVLVDVSLGDAEVAPRIRHLADTGFASIFVFGWSLAPADLRSYRAAGARGYVSMRLRTADLMSRLEETCPPRRLPEHGEPTGPLQELGCTDREAQVVTLICHGLSNAEIASELYLSPNSVKTYIRGAYRKIGLTRRSQVVVWGLKRGL